MLFQISLAWHSSAVTKLGENRKKFNVRGMYESYWKSVPTARAGPGTGRAEKNAKIKWEGLDTDRIFEG